VTDVTGDGAATRHDHGASDSSGRLLESASDGLIVVWERIGRMTTRLTCILPALFIAVWASAACAEDLPPPPAPGVAHLAGENVPASSEAQAMLTVDVPGRFSIRADSRTGVALQLVDMLAGPGDVAGEGGVRDGRIDALLDKGIYKIRTFGAAGATGDARLTVMPSHEAGSASAELLRGGEIATGLDDLGQRSFWILVDRSGSIFVEAAGRALADLRLWRPWRNGADLVDLAPALSTVEPRAGHPLILARLEGVVEPGIYLATAYGGDPLRWADGDGAMPLHVRARPAASVAAGVVEGAIGPFGSARFRLPAMPEVRSARTMVRLELPAAAPARLDVRQGTAAQPGAAIDRNSREPVAVAYAQGNEADPVSIEVSGSEGQPFRLRTVRLRDPSPISGSGAHLMTMEVAGDGGDELPASAVLLRLDQAGKAEVLASTAPRVGPGQAWRRRFNLRGPTDILFEVTAAGPLVARAQGPDVRISLEPLLASRTEGEGAASPRTFDVEPGWYRLKLRPVEDAAGVVDLGFGPPDRSPDVAPARPPRTAIPLGIIDLDKSARYALFADAAPGLVTALVARPLPADLASGPLVVHQTEAARPDDAPGPTLGAFDVPVRVPAGGTVIATDASGRPAAINWSDTPAGPEGRLLTVHIPATDRPRDLVLAWASGEPPEPVPPVGVQTLEPLSPAQPRFFDLKHDQQRDFRMLLGEGGLYRIETLGRLKTSAAVATAFLPRLDSASDNGAGHNALLQTYLRAGSYRVRVGALDSAGHLGIVARPARLLAAGTLVADGSARASLAEGSGAIFDIAVAEAGSYRLDLYGLGRSPRARLEDAEGWPLTATTALSKIERRLAPGRYRLVVLPEPVDARVVARLRRIVDPAVLQGHGPHPLLFDAVQKFEWREPGTKDAERIPDRWEFALEGEARISLDISDGMIADLVRTGGDATPIARLVFKRGFSGALPAGRYRVEARALGRNDRLDYELRLQSQEIEPRVPRLVELPAVIPFSIADDRVVNLTTFGTTDLSGVLKDATGRVIERLGARTDDWNIALSRRLPKGAYLLELDRASAGPAAAGDQAAEPQPETSEASEAGDDDGPAKAKAAARVEVRLELPDAAQVREVPLPAAAAGELMLVAAESASELVVSLERQEPGLDWQPVGFERGRSPVMAAPADGGASRWRASVWSIDGGPAPITVAVTNVRQPAQALGSVALTALALGGMTSPVRLAQVVVPGGTVITLAGSAEGLRQGSAPGVPLRAITGGLIAPQSDRLWLVARGADVKPLVLQPAPATPAELALSLGEGEKAAVRAGAVASGRARVWRADSTFGQPGLAGGPMGVAESSALALGADPVSVFNAGGSGPLQLHLESVDLELQPPLRLESEFAGLLAPRTAQPLTLPQGAMQLEIALAAGAGAMAGRSEPNHITVWAGRDAVNRQLTGDFGEVLLVNPGTRPTAVSVTLAPARPDGGTLATGQAMKRFFGAAGSLSLRLDAPPGDRLTVVGATATVVDARGRVQRGASLALTGPGELVLDHPAGLVAAWVEREGRSPWTAAPPVAISVPGRVALTGEAMALAIRQDAPALLHVRSTAPVILGLDSGQGAELAAFPAGAELHRYVAAGEAMLRVFSPHDGPLAGSLDVTATPVTEIAEGVADARALAPGGTAVFGFELKRAGDIGVGMRSEPDRATVRLLDAAGRVRGEGVVQLRRLEPGRYLLEARAPSDGRPITVRPALIGVAPRPDGPPPEAVREYLETAGLSPGGGRRGNGR
jgi:hypothetical protein